MEDYWKLISCWFTPDLRLNNCRPSVCWPIDRRRRASKRAHIKDVAVVEPRASLSSDRLTDGRRQILSVGANAAPSTAKVGLIASVSSTAAGGGGTDRCRMSPTYRSQQHTAHLSVTGVSKYSGDEHAPGLHCQCLLSRPPLYSDMATYGLP